MEKHDFQTSFRSKIRIDNDVIFCDYNGDNFHQITKEEIVVMGIHTNWNGPDFKYSYVDFVTDNNQWLWMPLYADNADKLVDYLHEQFQVSFRQALLTVFKEWNSLVIYPKYLEAPPCQISTYRKL